MAARPARTGSLPDVRRADRDGAAAAVRQLAVGGEEPRGRSVLCAAVKAVQRRVSEAQSGRSTYDSGKSIAIRSYVGLRGPGMCRRLANSRGSPGAHNRGASGRSPCRTVACTCEDYAVGHGHHGGPVVPHKQRMIAGSSPPVVQQHRHDASPATGTTSEGCPYQVGDLSV
jgi:hypothetical protein